MSSLFSSPSKQAQATAQAEGQISQQDISQLENYVSGQQGQLRGAISGLGENPYLGASPLTTPSQYKVNPSDTQSFGETIPPPGPTSSGNPFGPPPPPPQKTTNQGPPLPKSTNVPPPPQPSPPPTPSNPVAPPPPPPQVTPPPPTANPGPPTASAPPVAPKPGQFVPPASLNGNPFSPGTAGSRITF